MRTGLYEVIEKFDSKKDYDFEIEPRVKKCLETFQKGQKISASQYAKDHLNEFTRGDHSLHATANIVTKGIVIGKKIGIVRKVETNPISFDDFCKYETVEYCRRQLRGSKFRNKQASVQKISSTQAMYLYRLWHFNNWLVNKKFEFSRMTQTGIDTFKQEKQIFILESLEHFLKLYQVSHNSQAHFVKLVKQYLYDKKIHGGKRSGTMTIEYCAIQSYFNTNDSPLSFKYDPKTNYTVSTGEDDQPSLSLDDLVKILTVGKPSVMEKAVFLCKFQRGLDNATFADRFNYQAWKQLVDYFGTDDYLRWDLEKCPVPIKLTRVKTDYTHLGFVDRDAIEALQVYLKVRYEKIGIIMQSDQPLFINSKTNPIRDMWLNINFRKLARTAGIQRRLEGYERSVRYEKESHELRDLLKSTLIDSGVRIDIADHVIGHKPKDSYEKQAVLYPDSVRAEFMKASKRINVFSRISYYLNKGETENEILRKQIDDLKKEQESYKYSQHADLEKIKEDNSKILAWIDRQKVSKISNQAQF